MKLYISVDMEGLAGITNWKDETEDQVRFRKAMNEQVEWVLEGIAKSKRNKEITHIYIADSHGGGQNLSYDAITAERVSAQARWTTPIPEPRCRMSTSTAS